MVAVRVEAAGAWPKRRGAWLCGRSVSFGHQPGLTPVVSFTAEGQTSVRTASPYRRGASRTLAQVSDGRPVVILPVVAAYSVTRFDAIDEIEGDGTPYRPVRRHFGIASFGVSSFTGRKSGDRIINEHSEEDDQEELYLVLQGHATFELDGERVDAPAGTFVFAEPGVKRTAFAEEDGTTVVVVGGKPGKAYEVLGFEAWAPFQPLYEAGNYAEAADRARETIEAQPEAVGAFFCLACCEALAARVDDAARHLRHALERSERLRGLARRNSDLDSIRDRPEIAELLAV